MSWSRSERRGSGLSGIGALGKRGGALADGGGYAASVGTRLALHGGSSARAGGAGDDAAALRERQLRILKRNCREVPGAAYAPRHEGLRGKRSSSLGSASGSSVASARSDSSAPRSGYESKYSDAKDGDDDVPELVGMVRRTSLLPRRTPAALQSARGAAVAKPESHRYSKTGSSEARMRFRRAAKEEVEDDEVEESKLEDGAESPRRAGRTGGSSGAAATCDKCDAKDHATETCPWFRKSRDKHVDAQRRKPMNIGGDGKIVYVQSARVVSMPGDGSCLFHSLSHGLGRGITARKLRKEIANYILRNPTLEIAETPMKDWIHWDSGKTVDSYARRMALGGWGGGIECAACSRLYRVNVHIYERKRQSRFSLGGSACYKRISCFDLPGSEGRTARTINVLYCGGVHYNALELRGDK